VKRAAHAGRHLAGQWALAARFPAECLDGLTPATRAAFEAARARALRHVGYRPKGRPARLPHPGVLTMCAR
jgi:hypothetical protein